MGNQNQKLSDQVQKDSISYAESIQLFGPVFTVEGSKLYIKTTYYLKVINLDNVVAVGMQTYSVYDRYSNSYIPYKEVVVKEVDDQNNNNNNVQLNILPCYYDSRFTSKESEAIAFHIKDKICDLFEKHVLEV
jgi:hypothetical protein